MDIKHYRVQIMDAKALMLAVELLRSLAKKMQANGKLSSAELQAARPTLNMLLDYLMQNMGNPNIDQTLLATIMQVLGLNAKSIKKEREEEEELEKEEELTEEQRNLRLRWAIYEIYKITNPNQLAGETAIENFLNNVHVRGIEEAMKHEGAKYATLFSAEELKNIESHGHNFVGALKSSGVKTSGRGF